MMDGTFSSKPGDSQHVGVDGGPGREAFVAEADVAIVGGGPVGAALALSLARQGLTSVICDPIPREISMAADFDGRAYAVALATRRMLRNLGVWEQIAPEAQPIENILVSDGRVGERAAPLCLRFDRRELGPEGFGHMVEDRVIRAALLNKAAHTPGVTHLHGRAVASCRRDSHWAVASLDNGEMVKARLLVGCDGRGSRIAVEAGIDRAGWSYDQVGLVCAVRHERPHHGVAHELFLPSGPFAILPLTENRCSLVWTERAEMAESLRRASDEQYLAEIRRRFGGFLGELTLAGKRWAYPLNLTVAQRFIAPRLALAGDAARGIHPIAGQGMNYGMRDAAALAEVAGRAARLGEDIGGELVLQRYEQWRRPDSVMIAAATDGLNRMFSNDLEPLRWARRFGLAAFGGIAPLRRAAMRFAAGDRSDLPSLMQA